MAFVNNQASSSKSTTNGRTGVQAGRKGKKPKDGHKLKSNQARRQQVDSELKDLQTRVDTFEPAAKIELFSQLPLSNRTLKGLKSSHFTNPTPIQSLSIPPALQSRDVLGSAKTGSGKTLAFLIPLLERLYLLKWGPLDGLGAVVISPTRELAVQTFNQLRDIGKYHSFSAGLVIGGKPLKEEQERLGRMNILIATPGRLLQHLDSTVGFESAGVKVLVLDEADRLLDLGFAPALKAIVSHFSSGQAAPGARPDRQTLLFSATQSKDLAALVKLSLHDPLYINCNKAGEEGVVPSNLEQYYAVVGLERKLDALWGFIKSHLKMKGVVFVTSGKQVRFVFETFRRLHPGLPLLHLHGKQKQATRLSIFQKFSSSKSALLICTDVAARGLDFPAVDWVIQLDCPEDVDTYIHRVGRTARYQSEGKALLFLAPSEEEGMLKRWGEKSIEVKKIKIKASKMGDLKQQMQNFAFRDPEIKHLGQRAFVSYMRSVHIQKDKSIFKLSELPAEAFAASMGLPGAPQIKLADQKKAKKVMGGEKEDAEVVEEKGARGVVVSDDSEDEDENDGEDLEDSEEEGSGEESADISGDDNSSDEDEQGNGSENDVGEDEDRSSGESSDAEAEGAAAAKAKAVRTKYDRMFERKNQSILTPHYSSLVAHDEDLGDDGADDVFTLARRDHDIDEGDSDDDGILKETPASATTSNTKQPAATPLISSEDLSKRKLKAGTSKKAKIKTGPAPEKLIFDESGQAREFYEMGHDAESGAGDIAKRREFLEQERERMREADRVDREVAREKKREKKRKRKEREREREEEEGVAVLGGGSDEQDGHSFGYQSESEVEDRPKKGKKGRKTGREESLDDGGRGGQGLEDEEALALRLLQG